jgi:hypothetical protein
MDHHLEAYRLLLDLLVACHLLRDHLLPSLRLLVEDPFSLLDVFW